MTDKDFDFFKGHSDTFLEMALRMDRVEKMQFPDGYGKRTGDCGDTVEIFMQVEHRVVKRISFLVDGCINTTACCNTVVHLVEGKRIETAWEINPDDVAEYLETLPLDHKHCAELSVGALYRALLNYGENYRSPWKRMYASGSDA